MGGHCMLKTYKSSQVAVLLGLLLLTNFCLSPIQSNTLSTPPPSPPNQSEEGPGGSNYSHASVVRTRYNWGVDQYWIFEPDNPTPSEAPVIIFLHGWSAMFPIFYQPWIDHLVKRGNIVIYPRYQRGLYFGFEEFDDNALEAVIQAFEKLKTGSHIAPDVDKVAITGHSLGGGFTAFIAAEAEKQGLPIPKAIMPVQPAIRSSQIINYSSIAEETLMLVVVGEDDTVVGAADGKQIFYGIEHIPLDKKDFIIQTTDTYGTPSLLADHMAPVCIFSLRSPTVNAMDFFSTWKLFDALTDYAFYGTSKEYCLGNTSEQRFMGLWSDGTPVKELIVTDTP